MTKVNLPRRRAAVITIAIALTVAAGLTAWRHGGSAGAAVGGNAQAAAQPVPVVVAVAKIQNVPNYLRALGSVKSIDAVAVLPRVSGPIVRIFFKPGDDVKKGQPLFEIDPRPYQAALDQAQAQLIHDRAALAEASADLARYQQLAKTNAVPQQQAVDQKFLVKQDEGTVELDQANVETAKLNLGYCRITAPIDGRTGALQIDLGNIVQPTSTTPLVTITQLRPIYVSFDIPAKSLDEVRQYQAKAPLVVSARSQTGKPLGSGTLTLIDNQVNTATDTVNLQATFANHDVALWPGAFVSVQLKIYDRKNVVTVPSIAVMQGAGGSYVYMLTPDDTAHRVKVQIAARQAGIAVVNGSIAPGDRVVTDGQYRLADNVKVRIQPSDKAS